MNLTDYNITDNVGNNTWIIQGGDPCRLIGYWQCFATNEVGTVHNEIRVLPYGKHYATTQLCSYHLSACIVYITEATCVLHVQHTNYMQTHTCLCVELKYATAVH